MRFIAAELADGPLAALGPVLLCRPDDTFYCSNIRFWDGVCDPDCLYIGRASELPEQPPEPGGRYQLQLLLIGDAPVPPAWQACPAARIVLFPGDTDPLRLFNAISDNGFCLPRYAMKLTELLDDIPRDDFCVIADHISNILGRPTALLTPRLRLLACSADMGGDASTDRYFKPLWGYRLSGQLSSVMLDKSAGRVWPLKDFPGAEGALLAPILHEGELKEVLGYIYCPRIARADALANQPALRYISRLLSARFLRFIREDQGDSAVFVLLLNKIISGELKSDGDIASMLRQISFAVPKNMVLITIVADPKSSVPLMDYADAIYRDIWPGAWAAPVNNQVVLLIGSDETPVLRPESLTLFEARLADHRCNAGVSELFHSFDRYLRNHFHRAFCAAVVTGQRGGRRCGTYNEAALYHLTCDTVNAAALTPFRDAFVDPCLMRLVDYDADHGTEYLTTLRCYWLYNRNSAAICRLLHIQRSTLFYRLTKIRELLEQDFNDYQSLVQLSIGISILEARGVIPTLLPPEAPPAPGKTPKDDG